MTRHLRIVLVALFRSGACACTAVAGDSFYSLLNATESAVLYVVTLDVETTAPHEVACWASANLAVFIVMEVL